MEKWNKLRSVTVGRARSFRMAVSKASFHCLATDWTAKAGGAANDRRTAARIVGDLRIMGTGSAPSKAAGFVNVGPAALPTALESNGNLGGDEGAEPNEWVDATRSTGQRL